MGKEAITKELEKRRIPELLRLSDNTPVDTPQLWETRRKEIRDKKLVGMKPHRLVVRLPDGRSGGSR